MAMMLSRPQTERQSYTFCFGVLFFLFFYITTVQSIIINNMIDTWVHNTFLYKSMLPLVSFLNNTV